MKRETNRTPLQEVIPLDTPYVVHLEITNTCNLKCKFCSASNDDILKSQGHKRGFMPRKLFERIIDGLSEFPQKAKRLYFHIGGEPLLHKDIIHFLKYAKEKNVAQQMAMFTNGTLLTHELGKQLGGYLDYIQISVEGMSAEKYEKVTGKKIDYEKFLDNIKYLYFVKNSSCQLHAKTIDINLSDEEKEKFYNDFSGISDLAYIEKLLDCCPLDVMDTTMGFGSSTTQEGIPVKEKLICAAPFYVMGIYYNGMVSPCACDWRRNVLIGDASKESLVDIWNGRKANSLRRMHAEGKRSDCLACSDCKAIRNQIDDIDEYGKMILQKLPIEG